MECPLDKNWDRGKEEHHKVCMRLTETAFYVFLMYDVITPNKSTLLLKNRPLLRAKKNQASLAVHVGLVIPSFGRSLLLMIRMLHLDVMKSNLCPCIAWRLWHMTWINLLIQYVMQSSTNHSLELVKENGAVWEDFRSTCYAW